mgnify:CR=1 FL=1
MNVFLNSPGIMEFELKPGDHIIGHESKMTHCDAGIKFGKIPVEEANFLNFIKKQQHVVSFTNIASVNQFIIFSYDTSKHIKQIEVVDLRKIHGDLVIEFDTFFAGTSSVLFEEFKEETLFSKIGINKTSKKIVKGNGTLFLTKIKNRELTKIKLEAGKSLVINPDEVMAFSKSCLKESDVKTVNGLGLHFVGPGDVFIYEKASFLDNK